MKYTLIENYFETELFQNVVQEYFNSVLKNIIAQNSCTQAKGLFIKEGKILSDYYDMPYHTHILIGLIPSLLVYEKYMLKNDFVNLEEAGIYLKVFILGYTFHDSNKLLDTESDLLEGIKKLDEEFERYGVVDFFAEYIHNKNNIYYLALQTEDRTSIWSNNYTVNLDYSHLKDILSPLCHFADGLASKQGLDSIAHLYKEINSSLTSGDLSKFINLQLSFVKIRPNPYTLLSQNILRNARSVLAENGKKVLFSMYDGFIYVGDDVNEEEYENIYTQSSDRSDDIKPVELTKIDAQKCSFGFLGTLPFTEKIIDDVIRESGNKFLALSPNGSNKIKDYTDFIEFIEQLIGIYELPIVVNDSSGKLYLKFAENIETEWEKAFVKIYSLNKIKWLNSKVNKVWKKDFDEWCKKEEDLIDSFSFKKSNGDSIELSKISDVRQYIEDHTNSTSALYKTFLNLIKSYDIAIDEEVAEEYIETTTSEILNAFNKNEENEESTNKRIFFDRYFTFLNNKSIGFLNNYDPYIPEKTKMCAFTGAIGQVGYKEDVAFGMKARGFSNRTVTSLNNNLSHISNLYAEENKLRKSNKSYPKDANIVIYSDFFESHLDIDRDIIKAFVNAKNLKVLKNKSIEFDKNAKYQYNLFNLEFASLKPDIESSFFLVRKLLKMAQILGLRSYVTGLMAPYKSHKEIFCFENAPKYLRELGWDKVRLGEIESVLEEIKLVLLFGKKQISSNLIKIAEKRRVYFRLFYQLNDKDQKKIYPYLNNFINNNPLKFPKMTVTENLVDLGVKIVIGFKSGSEETWLIRTALEYLRKYVKLDSSREDIIQKISGEIYRKLRLDRPNMDAIEDFATAVYDELYQKDWKSSIPTINQEKDWIYQFGFLYKRKSLDIVIQRKADKIVKQLKDKKKEITEENILAILKKEKLEKHAEQYVSRILKK